MALARRMAGSEWLGTTTPLRRSRSACAEHDEDAELAGPRRAASARLRGVGARWSCFRSSRATFARVVVDAAARGTAGALPTLNVAAGLVTEPDFDASRWCELGGIACCRRGSSASSFLARPHFGVAPASAVRAELLSLRRSLRTGRARSAEMSKTTRKSRTARLGGTRAPSLTRSWTSTDAILRRACAVKIDTCSPCGLGLRCRACASSPLAPRRARAAAPRAPARLGGSCSNPGRPQAHGSLST